MTDGGEHRRTGSHCGDRLVGRHHSERDLRVGHRCYFGYYCCYCWVLPSPVLSSLRRTTRTSFVVVSSCFCSCHRRCHEFGNPLDAVEECLWDAREALDCPAGIRPVSCTRNRDRTPPVRTDTGRRTDCGGEDCTGRDEPAGTAGSDASQNRAFRPSDQSWVVAVASGGVE